MSFLPNDPARFLAPGNPQVFGKHALTLSQAWQQYDVLRSDPYVSFVGEPANLESQWRRFTERQTFSPKIWNDGYLAAFAQIGGFELVSFDKAMTQYSGIKCTILS